MMNPQGIIMHLYSQLYRAFQRLSTHCFVFLASDFTVLVHSHRSHQPHFQTQQAAIFSEKKGQKTCCTLPAQHQTADISFHSQIMDLHYRSICILLPHELIETKNRVNVRVKVGLTFARWPETQLQMDATLSPCLLDV